jgi:hypothetical protein
MLHGVEDRGMESNLGAECSLPTSETQGVRQGLHDDVSIIRHINRPRRRHRAQVTYFFYGPDYPNEVGYGSFFDVVHAQGQFGATNLSPKPEAMAFAAMTRIIDGTQTLGRLNGLPSMAYGYAFQQLGAIRANKQAFNAG